MKALTLSVHVVFDNRHRCAAGNESGPKVLRDTASPLTALADGNGARGFAPQPEETIWRWAAGGSFWQPASAASARLRPVWRHTPFSNTFLPSKWTARKDR